MSQTSSALYDSIDFTAIMRQTVVWAKHAGHIAMRDFKKVNPTRFKPDDSMLTPTDVEIEQFLMTKVQSAFLGHNVLAEEGSRIQTASPYTWIIDPLDGTTAFVRGLPGWGVSLALLYEDEPVFGLYYMPLLDDLTYAIPQSVVCNNERLHNTMPTNWDNNGFLAVSAGAHHDFEIGIPRTRALGSVSASLVYTARGSATAAFIPKAYLWDLAAGAFILKQAGGELRYLSGRPVELAALLHGHHAPEAIVAGHPAMVADTLGAIKPKVDSM